MTAYTTLRRPPRTMTELEQAKLLKVTGEHAHGFRDHVLFALALGTGLREHEALALDVGDVTEDGSTLKRRISLRVFKRCTDRPAPQEIFLPDSIHYKLGRFLAWKKRRGESLAPDAPLFVSREGNRLSTRMARTAFRRWQQRAGLDRIHSFHVLRHTACTNVYRKTRDIRLVQRFARHASIQTTTIYAQPSDEDLLRAVRELPC
jgi:site-specific recombinase XerD